MNKQKCQRSSLNCKGNLEINIIPSYHCDMNCNYCYNKYFYSSHCPDYARLMDNLSDILLKNDVNAIVEIIGGEPLSSKNYFVTKNIIQHLISLKKSVKVVLQTGSSDIEKLLEVIPKINGLSYSIDLSSSPKISNLKNLETIARCCKDHDVLIQILTILSPRDHIETICNFIDSCIVNGVECLGLSYPQYQLYTESELDSQVYVYSELIRSLKEFEGISIGGAVIESVVDFFSECTYSSACMCGENSITIQPDGSFSPSLHIEHDEFNSLETFVKCKIKRDKLLRENNCSKCKIWDVCHGGCMGHAKFLTGDIYSHDKEYCYLLSGVIERMGLI